PEAPQGADSVYHTGRQRAHKAQGIAYGNREFAWTHARRIGGGDGGKARRRDAKPRQIISMIARYDRRVEFAASPELDPQPRAACDVGIGDHRAVARPDHAGTVAAASRGDQNSRAPQLLCNFPEP